jgi:putative CocE/NonD family hydrolase
MEPVMPKRLLSIAIAVLALGTGSASAAQVTQDISFTASDGVVLHAAIGGEGSLAKRPLIIEDSPYAPACCAAIAGPAYNYIQLQWRGTGRSGGKLTATGLRDQQDLSEFVSWACTQPWSDGRIGLYGFSASAIVVYNAMHLPLPCVKAAALMAGTVDLYRDLLYIGGVQNSAPGLYVLGAIFAPWLQNLGQRMAEQPQSIPDSIQGFATASPDVQTHQTEDAFWQDRTYKGNPANIPVLADTGFYDVESRGPFLAYRATRDVGSHLLVIGAHDGSPAGSGGPFPHYTRWFDHFVRGIDNGADREAPVSLYLSNGSREELLAGHTTHLEGTDWPLPDTKWTRLYLSPAASGTAKSINDGTLALAPDASAATQTYPFHPSNAFATDPHTTAAVAGLGLDQFATFFPQITRMDLAEPTSLTYTTAPLQAAVNAVGPASLDVFASSSAPETHLYAVIADVWLDGTAHPVAVGMLNTSFPGVDRGRSLIDPATGDLVQPYSDFSAKDSALPGTSREYHVELPPIGNHFATGHRIRLYVVGTSGYQQPAAPGANTLSIGGITPSRLILPSAQSADIAAALG